MIVKAPVLKFNFKEESVQYNVMRQKKAWVLHSYKMNIILLLFDLSRTTYCMHILRKNALP